MARSSSDAALDSAVANTDTTPQALALALSQAAAAFRDADFFESAVLYWSVALAHTTQDAIDHGLLDGELLEHGLDIEQALGLDVQLQEPIELVYPPTTRRLAAQRMLRQHQPPPSSQSAGSDSGAVDQTMAVAATAAAATVDTATLPQQQQQQQQQHTIQLGRSTTPPLYAYILSALAYLARQINVRIDILPSGQDTLTSLGPPQRYYGALSPAQQSLYHEMLDIVFATASLDGSSACTTGQHSHHDEHGMNPWQQHPASTILGNEVAATWQIMIPQKRIPHSLPRFFSYLNPGAGTVAGCSIPRNELDIAALAESGVRFIVTLIKETPLPQAWFPPSASTVSGSSSSSSTAAVVSPTTPLGQSQGGGQGSSAMAAYENLGENQEEDAHPHAHLRNAFVPIENLKAVAFPEILETIVGWCLWFTPASAPQARPHAHQNAVLVHCGGGKGRAGLVLAAYLMRFGLAGHGAAGYCRECVTERNLHPHDLAAFDPRRASGGSGSGAAGQPSPSEVSRVLPKLCFGRGIKDGLDNDVDDSEDDDGEDGDQSLPSLENSTCSVNIVKARHCVNRYKPKMTARDAMAYLRAIRPGSIETTVQEMALKAYGNWLWKRASEGGKEKDEGGRHGSENTVVGGAAESLNRLQKEESIKSGGPSTGRKGSKGKGKDKTLVGGSSQTHAKQKHQAVATAAKAERILEDEDSEQEGRRGKKGKNKQKQQQQQEGVKFVPPPAHKIIKLPGGGGRGSHHQHHLIVQHNMRARQLQRGQKKDKGGSNQKLGRGGNPTSFRVVGTPLDAAPPPKLIVLTGLPGSGKSHLVARLLAQFPEHFVQISQDELGSRSVCERLLAQSMRHQQQSALAKGQPGLALPMSVIVDRCNPTVADRKGWYETAFQPDETCMIWFSASKATCIERVEAREHHPTLDPAKAQRVIHSFSKEFEVPNLQKESWCKTLVEVGDFEGAEQIFQYLADLATAVPGSAPKKALTSLPPTRASRPAFIPAKVLERRQQVSGAGADSGSLTGMDKVEEEEEEDNGPDGEEEEDESETSSESKNDGDPESNPGQAIETPLSRALQFALPTGHRPAFKKPARGSYRSPSQSGQNEGGFRTEETQDAGTLLAKGVKFATPISSYARPMQKFPRTPHLFDPLRIPSSMQSSEAADSPRQESKSSPAISRNDLLLPPSALDQVFCPKANQVLTVEEKMDGANLGFSVLHFKPMAGSTTSTWVPPPPKIRVQNRSHFVNADDHWQFKKLDQWLDRYREDVLWLCEGRWRYETRDGTRLSEKRQQQQQMPSDQVSKAEQTEESAETQEEENDDNEDDKWQDTCSEKDDDDDDDEEYVDENQILQDGLAAYVLYGEWLYAKHSIRYTGLESWFVPFDLLDVKTGMFVSRKVFARAIGQTQLRGPPQIAVPDNVLGDTSRMLEWVQQQLESTSRLMRQDAEEEEDNEEEEEKEERGKKKKSRASTKGQERRVEGLYFRIDQGERLWMRSKVVRPDFIVGEERWGTKEQVANELRWDAIR